MDQSFRHHDIPGEPLRTELQQRVDRGEPTRAILEELYLELQVELFARAFRSLRDAGRAKEHIQELFLDMFLKVDEIIAHRAPKALIRTMARNRLIDNYRNRVSSRPKEVGDVVDDFDRLLERDLAGKAWSNRFDEHVATWVGFVEPVNAYLLTIVANGWVRAEDMDAYLQGVLHGITQKELAQEFGLTQGRISQLKSEVSRHVRVAIYLCEVLGIVRPPHREAEIRSHLDLLDLADSLTTQDRKLLRQAGGAIRRDSLDQVVLFSDDAEAAIQPRNADRVVPLQELHDAETRYSAAIPNPTPHCIDSPCQLHTASPQVNEGRRR